MIIKQPNMKCPLCDQEVVRVVESDKDIKSEIKCENEYFRHYGDSLEKFITPKTSPDHIRFAMQ